MKHRIYQLFSLLAAVVAPIIAGCTLIMDDLALPEDKIGFDAPVEQTTEVGTIKYQFKDNVKYIAKNVLPYIYKLEADTIIYYLDNTPKDMLPKVGECVAASNSPKIVDGLCHRVLKVENIGGMYRVTTTPADLKEVYEVFEARLDFDSSIPAISAIDSTLRDSLGITDEDMEIVDWSVYKRLNPDVEIPETRVSRAIDVDDDIEGSINLFNLNTMDMEGSPFNTVAMRQFMNNMNQMNKSIVGGVALKAKILLELPVHISAYVSLFDGWFVKITVSPSFLINFGIGAGAGGGRFGTDKDFATWALAAELWKGQHPPSSFELKIAPDLPSVKIPIGPTGGALSVFFSPRFSIKCELCIMGEFSYRYYVDPFVIYASSEDSYCKQQKTDRKKSETNVSLAGNAGLTIAGGVNTGVKLIGTAEVGAYNDLELSFNAGITFVESDGFSQDIEGIAYTPSKNRLYCKLDNVTGVRGKILGHEIEKEFLRLKLMEFSSYIRPDIDEFCIDNYNFNPETDKLRAFDAKIWFNSTGWLSNYNSADAVPAVVVAPLSKTDEEPCIYEMDRGYADLETDHFYTIQCMLGYEDPEGYLVAPAIRKADGELAIINGHILQLASTGSGFSVRNLKNTFIAAMKYGSNESTKSNNDFIKKQFKDVKDIENYWYYSWITKMDICGGPNIKKWGVQVNIGTGLRGISESIFKRDYDIEDNDRAGIYSGTKTLRFEFIDNLDPNDIWKYYELGSATLHPYTISVTPFYVRSDGKRTYLHGKTTYLKNWPVWYQKSFNEFSGKVIQAH